MSIAIRPVTGYHEYMACEEIQRAVWGEFGVVPHHMLLTVQHSGGLCLGAFDTAVHPSGMPSAFGPPLVGFVFGFLGRTADGHLKHASHMAAVLPGYRDAQIGERLKWAQREHALAQGLDLMTWTFDPLISRNAYLNIAKLGAVCRTYVRNIYGPEPEDPRGDLPSDRFRVDWWLSSRLVLARRDASSAPVRGADLRAMAPLVNPDPMGPIEEPASERMLVQIPADVETLKATNMTMARSWRYQVRAIAEAAFARGFTVTDFARDGEVGLYLLRRG